MNRNLCLISLVSLIGGLATGAMVRSRVAGNLSGGVESPAAEPSATATPADTGRDEAGKKAADPESHRDLVRKMLRDTGGGGLSSLEKAWWEAAGNPMVREWLTAVWTRENPDALLQVMCSDATVESEKGGNNWFTQIKPLAELVAGRNPERVMRLAGGIACRDIRLFLKGEAVMAAIREDTAKGLRMALEDREAALIRGTLKFDVKVGVADIAVLEKLPFSFNKRVLLEKALGELPVESAIERAFSYTGLESRMLVSAVAQRWVKEDRDAAITYLETRASEIQRPLLGRAIAERMLKEDPRAAADWVQRNLSGAVRNQILLKAADALKESDPAVAEAIRVRTPKGYQSP